MLEGKKSGSLIQFFKPAVMSNNRAVAGGIVKESLATGVDKENFNQLMCEVGVETGSKLYLTYE